MSQPRESDEEAAAVPLAEKLIKSSPPWLVSSVVHMLILVMLGLWLIPPMIKSGVELKVHYADQLGDELADNLLDMQGETASDETIITPDNLPEVSDPFAAPPTVDSSFMGSAASSEIVAPQIGLALSGRDEGMRKALMSTYGGSATSELAVKYALEWLAKQQQSDGSWSLRGPYDDGVNGENATAATAMAMLAFQGNGHTHQKGLFQKQVDKALKYLLKMQDRDGSFFREVPGNARLYTQGQVTIALCELYGMTQDPQLREPCEKCVKFCVESQDSLGGWRYVPGTDSDTSVTGWIVMGLQSARMARLDVPTQTLQNVHNYLDKAQSEGGARYAYVPGAAPSETMTAEGLLCRQYLGWSQSDPRFENGAQYLISSENLPSWNNDNRNVYFWYYATQMLHHHEGEPWKKWNSVIRDLLVDKQVKSGRERGSWDPIRPTPDRWGGHAGRLYVTCLSVYILEVYYRHLPLYSGVRLGVQ